MEKETILEKIDDFLKQNEGYRVSIDIRIEKGELGDYDESRDLTIITDLDSDGQNGKEIQRSDKEREYPDFEGLYEDTEFEDKEEYEDENKE